MRTSSHALRAFLFADIRGYTSYTREHGDEAAGQLAQRCANIVGELAPAHGGTLQELRGDEALVVFDSARQALRFGVAIHERVAAEALPRRVGVGLDAGEAVRVADGFRGGALNRAARLCSLAGAGEVLASENVVHLAGRVEGIDYGLRRVERLKGFARPVAVVEIHHPEAHHGGNSLAGRSGRYSERGRGCASAAFRARRSCSRGRSPARASCPLSKVGSTSRPYACGKRS